MVIGEDAADADDGTERAGPGHWVSKVKDGEPDEQGALERVGYRL